MAYIFLLYFSSIYTESIHDIKTRSFGSNIQNVVILRTIRKLLSCYMWFQDARRILFVLVLWFATGLIKLWYAWLKWGQGMGSLDDASHCMCVLMCLTGNLEHAIKWVVLPSSSCFSGTQADAAIELHRQNNAALECVCVCEHVKQRQTWRNLW